MYKQTASTLFNPFKTCLTPSMLLTLVFSCITQLQWLSQCSGSCTYIIISAKKEQAQESPAGLESGAGGKSGGLQTNLFPFAMCTQFHHYPSDYYTKKPSIMGLLYILLFSRVFLLRNLNALVKPEHNLVSVTEITGQRWICFLFCLCYLLDYAFYSFRYFNWAYN